jgi:hypothetical protein
MSISLKTHKLLWGRSGNRCAFEECRRELIADETETDDESVIGDEAHIVARNIDGPRGISDMTEEDRDKYDNLILLCRIHHKIIDDQPLHFTVGKLKEVKRQHETWVKKTLHLDKDKEKDDLIYATYIDEVTCMFDFQNWNAWTSSLLSNGQPRISYKRLKALEKVPDFIVSRYWPERYSELEDSLFNFKNVLNDLLKVFYMYADENSLERAENSEEDRTVFTKKFYHISEWNPELYDDLLKQFEYHVALVEDLTLELTRAANLVSDKIRKFMSPKFREEEGKLLITTGPFIDLSWKTYKVEYKSEEKSEPHPYHGLKKFMNERENRNMHMGKGVSIIYLPERFE